MSRSIRARLRQDRIVPVHVTVLYVCKPGLDDEKKKPLELVESDG